MNKCKIVNLSFLVCLVLLAYFNASYGKEKYLYRNGHLIDIQLSKEFTSGVVGGYSYDIYYPKVKVSEITYIGKSRGKLKDWIIGDPVRVRFNDKKTKMYLKRANGRDYGIEVVKRTRY